MITFNITQTDHGRRIDSFIANLLPTAPQSYVRKLVTSGHVMVNGTPVVASDSILRFADVVTLKESARTKGLLGASPVQLDWLYEDRWIVAFNKPPGIPMHPAAEVDDHNVVAVGTELMLQRDGRGALRPINRLDRGTSGVVLLAKTSAAAAEFGRMIMSEGLGKLYLALVNGKVPSSGRITAPLGGKDSETRYQTIVQGKDKALLALFPLTGRMHQIRQHLSLIHHPVIGDRRYGGRAHADITGHALHSFCTGFVHPFTGERVKLLAPLPERFFQLLMKVSGATAPELLAKLDGVETT